MRVTRINWPFQIASVCPLNTGQVISGAVPRCDGRGCITPLPQCSVADH